jgi:hypothetical protein
VIRECTNSAESEIRKIVNTALSARDMEDSLERRKDKQIEYVSEMRHRIVVDYATGQVINRAVDIKYLPAQEMKICVVVSKIQAEIT